MDRNFAFNMLRKEKRKKESGGGPSAAPKLSYGSNARLPVAGTRTGGSRSRSFAMPPSANAVVFAQYVKTNADSSRHMVQFVDYLENKNRKPWEERKFFDRENTGLDKDLVLKDLLLNQGKDISMHKLVLSPGDNSVNQLEYTRETMERLEEQLGYNLNWVAMDQYNTDHHHTHVIVSGRIPEQDHEDRGESMDRHAESWARFKEGKDLKLTRENLADMRTAGNEHLLRERGIDYELDLAIAREFGIDYWSCDKYMRDQLEHDPGRSDYLHRDFMERELGLTGWQKDYDSLQELGIENSQYDRQVAKEFGFYSSYDLDSPFVDDTDRTADQLFDMQTNGFEDFHALGGGDDREQDIYGGE